MYVCLQKPANKLKVHTNGIIYVLTAVKNGMKDIKTVDYNDARSVYLTAQ